MIYNSPLLAIDPSVTRLGYAVFDAGILKSAGTVSGGNSSRSYLQRSEAISLDLLLLFGPMQKRLNFKNLILAFEWPVIRNYRTSKGDPNGILPLAAVCGAIVGQFPNKEIRAYKPEEWIGQVPKIETVSGCKSSARAKKIKLRLSGEELGVWDRAKYHDEIDAIGIGLHALGRLKRIRKFPTS